MAAATVEKIIDSIAADAKKAAAVLRDVPPSKITAAIAMMARLLSSERAQIDAANAKDVRAARQRALSPAMIDRLTLSDAAYAAMIGGLATVARLPNPTGRIFDARQRPNGLSIYKMRVPIGVIGIIYESRPNVTVDAAALCLKSLNAVVLRGGSEAIHSNIALAKLFSSALAKCGLPPAAVQIVPTADRRAIELLLRKEDGVDLIIPRGGEGLIRMVVEKSRIPVIKHYKGVCHVYVSKKASMEMALPIVINAKTQRPGVCNAMETLLLDSGLSRHKMKTIIGALQERGVQLFGDTLVRSLGRGIGKATEEDWRAEYLDLRLAVRVVNGVSEAAGHINTFGSHHTDAIVTDSAAEARQFIRHVDSSSVMVNASTRFSDGGEYGMGCEVGISTDKLHARGPMGVEDLTTYKWIVRGSGQIRK